MLLMLPLNIECYYDPAVTRHNAVAESAAVLTLGRASVYWEQDQQQQPCPSSSMEFQVHHTQAHAPSTCQSTLTRANWGPGQGSKPTLSSTQLVIVRTAASVTAPDTVTAPMCTETSALLSQAWTPAVFQTPPEQLEHFLRVGGGTLFRDSGPIPYVPTPGPVGPGVTMPYAAPARISAPTLIGTHHLPGLHPGGLQQDLAVDTRRRQLHNRVLQSNYSHPAYQQVPAFVVEPAQQKIQGPHSRVSEAQAQVCNLYN